MHRDFHRNLSSGQCVAMYLVAIVAKWTVAKGTVADRLVRTDGSLPGLDTVSQSDCAVGVFQKTVDASRDARSDVRKLQTRPFACQAQKGQATPAPLTVY